MIAAQRRTPKPENDLPPLMNGAHLVQKTFHERYEAMTGVRAELIGGIVGLASPEQAAFVAKFASKRRER